MMDDLFLIVMYVLFVILALVIAFSPAILFSLSLTRPEGPPTGDLSSRVRAGMGQARWEKGSNYERRPRSH